MMARSLGKRIDGPWARARPRLVKQTQRTVLNPMTSSDLVTYSELAPLLPIKIEKARLLRLSAVGKFPPYTRVERKGEPFFNRAAVVEWIRQKFDDVLPQERIDSIVRGLAPAVAATQTGNKSRSLYLERGKWL